MLKRSENAASTARIRSHVERSPGEKEPLSTLSAKRSRKTPQRKAERARAAAKAMLSWKRVIISPENVRRGSGSTSARLRAPSHATFLYFLGKSPRNLAFHNTPRQVDRDPEQF